MFHPGKKIIIIKRFVFLDEIRKIIWFGILTITLIVNNMKNVKCVSIKIFNIINKLSFYVYILWIYLVPTILPNHIKEIIYIYLCYWIMCVCLIYVKWWCVFKGLNENPDPFMLSIKFKFKFNVTHKCNHIHHKYHHLLHI